MVLLTPQPEDTCTFWAPTRSHERVTAADMPGVISLLFVAMALLVMRVKRA